MDIALVTGAETALGLRIVQSLVQQGCRVHGIGNNFSKVTYADPQFKGHAVDLTDTAAVAALLESILADEKRLDLLVHAIDVTPGAPFEKLSPGNLEAVLKVGLLDPVLLTRLALPNLLRFRGQLIHVITSNKNGQPASALNALIEGGLREMNRALFDRSRDAGLRVTNCFLRQNTALPGGQVSDAALEQTHIDLEDVARVIEQLVDPKAVNVPAEVVLYPRLSAAAGEALPETPLPLDPYAAVTLPPKAYCPPPEAKIPTIAKQQIERTIPYTDEEMEDRIAAAIEEYELHPERYDFQEPRAAKRAPRQQAASASSGEPAEASGEPGRAKRRRRRGGRNRNKSKPGGAGSVDPSSASGENRPRRDESAPAVAGERESERRRDRGQDGGRERNRERRRDEGPRERGEGDRPDGESREARRPSPDVVKPVETSSPAPRLAEGGSGDEGAKQTPAKKAAKKKAAKKAAKTATKTPAKKAAKKKAAKKTAAEQGTFAD